MAGESYTESNVWVKTRQLTMIISVIERMTFGCPTCSELMTGDIVHVIDSEEQAQLWSHCIQKGFNRLVCRKGHALTPAIPLLAHDRAQRRLVFCPSNGTDDVAGEIEIAESMVARVHKYLPPNLDKTHLNQAEVVSLDYLPHTLLTPPAGLSRLLELAKQPFGLRECVTLCKDVLAGVRRQDSPRVWADFQQWLAEGLLCSDEHVRVTNLEEAQRRFAQAETVYDAATYPFRHAELEVLIGTAYAARLEDEAPVADLLGPLDAAEKHFQQAISLLSPEQAPRAWVRAHVRLGAVILAVAEEQNPSRCNEALKCFAEAQRANLKDRDPVEDLVSQQSVARLTELLLDSTGGTMGASERRPLRFLPFATRSETANEHIAMLYSRAQKLVVTRAIGVSDILENALVCLQAAEARLSKHTEPKLIADVVALLGDVYAMRYEGDKEANLRASIHALELASKLYELASAVDERIRALSSLGSSFRQLADVLPPESQQTDSQSHAVDSELGQRNARAGATKSFELAVTLLNDLRAPSPAYAIAVHNNLGNALQAQFDGVDLSPLRRAAEEYKTSIDLVSRIREGAVENLFAEGSLDEVEADTRSNLGSVLHKLSRFETGAAGSAEDNLRDSFDFYKRLHLWEDLRRVALALHRLYVDGGRIGDALQVLDDAIAGAEALVEGAGRTERQQYESRWSSDLYKAACSLHLSSAPGQTRRVLELSDDMRAQLLRFEYRAARRKTLARDKIAAREGVGTAHLNWGALQEWLETRSRRVVIVEFLVLQDEVIAFVIKQGFQQPRIFRISLGLSQVVQMANMCVRDVHNYTPDFPSRGLWSKTASLLFEPLMGELEEADLVLCVPNELLYLVPLHAVKVQGKTLGFVKPFIYAPSITTAINASRAPEGPPDFTTDQIAVVGSSASFRPEGGTPYYTVEELEGAEREIEMVAEALRVRPIRGSKSDIVSALRRHSYVHIACHGNLNPEDPMQSGLVLGNEVLTVRELLESSIDCHMVVLSACHSAFVSPEPGDPFVSLSAAFLYAGAHHVVAAQWAVSDEITTSLISRFYEEFHARALDSFGIASSLSTASHSIEKEQAEPYYWAPFGVFGGCD